MSDSKDKSLKRIAQLKKRFEIEILNFESWSGELELDDILSALKELVSDYSKKSKI